MSQEKFLGSELKLDDFLRVVDVATAIRQRQEEIGQQLDVYGVKGRLKGKLRETAEVTGEILTDTQIDSAVDSYFEGLYSFKETERDLGTRFAEMYVDRGRLTRRYVLPAVVFGAATGAIIVTIDGIKSARLRAQEREVEGLVEVAYQDSRTGLSEIDLLLNTPFNDKLPHVEKDQLASSIDEAQQKIKSADPFFDQYCSDGTAEDDITSDNLQDARNGLIRTNVMLGEAYTAIENGKVIIKTEENLALVRRNMDTLIEEVRTLNPHEALRERAEIFYSAGQGEIERRNLEGAKKNEDGLRETRDGVSQFSGLVSKVESLYGSVRAVAVENEALQRGETLYGEARQFIEAADIQRLSQSIFQLDNLAEVLSMEYTLRIVNRSGVKSGIDRYYTDENGKRASGHYLIVEAVASDGSIIPMHIRNEENGKTERVKMWGERVANEVYERVKRDKLDNGIINDDIVGTKKRGYLSESFTMKEVIKEGQITRW